MSESHASMRGRIAAYEKWARTGNRTAATAPARAGLDAKFVAEVDPDGTLDPADRARRVAAKRKAHFTRLALLSAQSRRRAQAARRTVSEEKAITDAQRIAASLHSAADEIAAAAGLDI